MSKRQDVRPLTSSSWHFQVSPVICRQEENQKLKHCPVFLVFTLLSAYTTFTKRAFFQSFVIHISLDFFFLFGSFGIYTKHELWRTWKWTRIPHLARVQVSFDTYKWRWLHRKTFLIWTGVNYTWDSGATASLRYVEPHPLVRILTRLNI